MKDSRHFSVALGDLEDVLLDRVADCVGKSRAGAIRYLIRRVAGDLGVVDREVISLASLDDRRRGSLHVLHAKHRAARALTAQRSANSGSGSL